MRTAFVVACLLGSAFSALAQQTPPTCSAAEYHQFDFWIGDWTVTDSTGTATLGTNLVASEEKGCLLHEHWVGTKGGTGQSFNFYDRATGHWAQVWVSNSGNALRLEGSLRGTAMQLEGSAPSASGTALQNRIVWTPLPDGRVRQAWFVSQDGGQTWRPSFIGWYRRKAG